MKLSALDWRNLSTLYQDLADAVLNYRISNSTTLTLDQKNSLNVAFGELLTSSETFANQALQQATFDIDASIKNIQASTHDAISAIRSVTVLKNVLDISIAAIGLATTMLAPTPGTVATALGHLVAAIQETRQV
jgi:hypothetical protein